MRAVGSYHLHLITPISLPCINDVKRYFPVCCKRSIVRIPGYTIDTKSQPPSAPQLEDTFKASKYFFMTIITFFHPHHTGASYRTDVQLLDQRNIVYQCTIEVVNQVSFKIQITGEE